MACAYFTASNLDGFIVDPDGSLDWLLSREIRADEGPYGYEAFIETVGALVMGAAISYAPDGSVGQSGPRLHENVILQIWLRTFTWCDEYLATAGDGPVRRP
jgi:hypothetical protein